MSRGQGTEGVVGDPEYGTVIFDNQTDIDDGEIRNEVLRQHPEIAALAGWTNDVTGTSRRRAPGSIFDRDRFVTPKRFIDQIDVARDAVAHDDVVSGIVESTESLAFGRLAIETDDPDEEDIWGQISIDIDLDSRLREMWRELATVSQIYIFQWFGNKDYTVRGKSKDTGTRRKKTYKSLRVPIGLTLLNPKKIIPVGSGFFNQEKLLYIPTDREEQKAIDAALDGSSPDPMIKAMLQGQYKMNPSDFRRSQEQWDFPRSTNLYVCNPQNVWRHTLTKNQWEMLAELRLAAVFELLDLKTQLKEMDRAHLIGGTNFIILIKKGSDAIPAKPAEIANLQGAVRVLARVPMLIGDHRLSLEIITPKMDLTLKQERYDLLDSRIAMRMYQMFTTGSGKEEDSLKLGRVIARGMESRRHMLRLAVERHTLRAAFKANEQLKEEPCLRFYPKQISLSFDTAQAMYFMDLRDRREISRDTLLSQIDLSEDEEARKMEREAEFFDDIFQSTVPFSGKIGMSTETEAAPRTGGRTGGGNKNGGGAAPGTGQGESPQKTKPADGGSKRKSNT